MCYTWLNCFEPHCFKDWLHSAILWAVWYSLISPVPLRLAPLDCGLQVRASSMWLCSVHHPCFSGDRLTFVEVNMSHHKKHYMLLPVQGTCGGRCSKWWRRCLACSEANPQHQKNKRLLHKMQQISINGRYQLELSFETRSCFVGHPG